MADNYATTQPPQVAVPRVGTLGPAIWTYTSVDVDSDVNASGYFSNGVDLGMQVGDIIFVHDTATPKSSVHYVVSITGTTVVCGFAAVA